MLIGLEQRLELNGHNLFEALARVRLLKLTFEHVVADVGYATNFALCRILSHVVQMVTKLDGRAHLKAPYLFDIMLFCQVKVVGAHFLRRIRVVYAHTFAFF